MKFNIDLSNITLLIIGIIAAILLIKAFEVIRKQEKSLIEINQQINPRQYIPDAPATIDTIA